MRKAVMAKGGLDKALQRLVQKGEWDKARVDRFRGRVRDHVRGVRDGDGPSRATKKSAPLGDEGKATRRRGGDD